MKNFLLFLMLALTTAFTAFSLISCGDDDDEGVNSNDVAVTGKVSEITAVSAVINGTVNADLITATYSTLEMGIEISSSPDFSYPERFKAYGLIGKSISVRVTGLTPKTKYYYRTYVDISSSFAYYGSVATFTTSDLNKTSISGTDNGHNYVDLGLPSGTKWADCNVGASSMTDYGEYYAWGETATKSEYDLSTYTFNSNNTELDFDDDVAHKFWGGSWRMPSEEQLLELILYTTSQWTTVNGKTGRLFTASNGNYIFLPAAGGRYDTSLGGAGSCGRYWSRTLDADYPINAYDLYFDSCGVYVYNYSYFGGDRNRVDGQSVRPVRP